mmetsp:Transcript_21677/g.45220  ORF Transcript_21677/g.45220 Transcript_21677/m.45220 type:complete len:862 (+) Transcript_21677:103-2688(+)
MRLCTPSICGVLLLGFLQADGKDSNTSSEFRRTQTSGRCYPDNSVSTGTSSYGCHAAKFCSNQLSADRLGTMSLASCMAECDSRWSCEEIQYDCNTDCWIFTGSSSCGTLQDTSCGSSYYYKTTTTTTTETTELILGACWPNMASSTDFRCTAAVYCDSQNDGTNHGEIPLEQCVALCRSTFNCNYIQYDCNEVCLLLEECHQTRPTVCGSSIYRYENADIATSTSSEQATAEAAEPDPEPAMEDVDLPALFLISGFCILVLSVFFRCYLQRMRNRSAGAAKFVLGAGSGSVIGSIGIRTTLCDGEEDLEPLTFMARQNLPRYWSTSADLQEVSIEFPAERRNLGFGELAYVKHEHFRQFQYLVNHTYQAIPTQDRLCPTDQHGKTRGGCACVQPGGSPGLPTGFQVKRVIRVEDSDMFNRYIKRRDQIKMSRLKCAAPDPKIRTQQAIEAFPGLQEVVAQLDSDLNETYLWHGTRVRTGLQIAQEDFNLTFAGSGAGTMYGKGLYFSESSTKADEYSQDEPSGYYHGVRALLLCRVCMGEFYYTGEREQTAIEKFMQGISDSTLGDRAKAVNTYREFVVYNKDQVYPEYLVLYERLHGTRPPEPPPKDLPFLLELPLYWKNVGKNPRIQEFHDHWLVRPKISNLIYRMALHTSENSCPKVQRAKRVEDSVLWCKYINWKKELARQLEVSKMDRCTPPNELDGTPSSGHVLTGEILAEHDGVEAISLENMVAGLNELLLWHGTSREAAAAIANDGFVLNNNALHGRRFGNGVYLAEDLRKSLSYCKEADGVKYVLLCRAVCGEMFYTEQQTHRDAPERAREQGKQSVLANPDKVGPREYILFDTAQVYPEYIVEFVTRSTE